MIRISRRQLVTILGLVGATSVVGWHLSHEGRSGEKLEFELPPPEEGGRPSFSVFLALSKIVTGRSCLNEKIVRDMLAIFLAEPWGPEHIMSSYRRLYDAITKSDRLSADPVTIETAALEEGESWFLSHLLMTWYLGIYYHEERPTVRICYEEALMYDSTRNVIPIWFTGSHEENYWAKDVLTGDALNIETLCGE